MGYVSATYNAWCEWHVVSVDSTLDVKTHETLAAKVFTFHNFHSLKAASRWRDSQLQVGENDFFNDLTTIFYSC